MVKKYLPSYHRRHMVTFKIRVDIFDWIVATYAKKETFARHRFLIYTINR